MLQVYDGMIRLRGNKLLATIGSQSHTQLYSRTEALYNAKKHPSGNLIPHLYSSCLFKSSDDLTVGNRSTGSLMKTSPTRQLEHWLSASQTRHLQFRSVNIALGSEEVQHMRGFPCAGSTNMSASPTFAFASCHSV